MEIQPDFEELLALFNAHGVEYMVVGGYALAFHGAPRYTGDMGLNVAPTLDNAQRILDALNAFGFGTVGLESRDLATENKVVQLGVSPVRIDLLTSLSGVYWKEAHARRVPGQYGAVPVYYIGRDDFIRNKKAIGRYQDLADSEALGGNPD